MLARKYFVLKFRVLLKTSCGFKFYCVCVLYAGKTVLSTLNSDCETDPTGLILEANSRNGRTLFTDSRTQCPQWWLLKPGTCAFSQHIVCLRTKLAIPCSISKMFVFDFVCCVQVIGELLHHCVSADLIVSPLFHHYILQTLKLQYMTLFVREQ